MTQRDLFWLTAGGCLAAFVLGVKLIDARHQLRVYEEGLGLKAGYSILAREYYDSRK